jgi:hypothetical protein
MCCGSIQNNSATCPHYTGLQIAGGWWIPEQHIIYRSTICSLRYSEYRTTATGMLISPYPDQEGNKLQASPNIHE